LARPAEDTMMDGAAEGPDGAAEGVAEGIDGGTLGPLEVGERDWIDEVSECCQRQALFERFPEDDLGSTAVRLWSACFGDEDLLETTR